MQDMKTIKAKLHLVATERSRILKHKDGTIFYYHKEQIANEFLTPMHLYFTSDEEIKGGDWVIDKYNNLSQVFGYLGRCKEEGIRKVVATTNKSLGLPQPTKQLVEAYCKKPFDECLIEMIRVPKPIHNYPLNAPWEIKVNSYNEITCHPVVEKMYSEKDMLHAMQYAYTNARDEDDFKYYIDNLA